MRIGLTINGIRRSLDVAPGVRLLEVLRSEGLFSVKYGCDTGECVVCAVQVDGVPRNTCVMLAAQADGTTITSVEGLGTPRQMHPLQQALADNGSVQCGYCIPAMVVAAQALLKDTPNPTKSKSATPSPAIFAAAPATSNRCKPSRAPPLSCAAKLPHLSSATAKSGRLAAHPNTAATRKPNMAAAKAALHTTRAAALPMIWRPKRRVMSRP